MLAETRNVAQIQENMTVVQQATVLKGIKETAKEGDWIKDHAVAVGPLPRLVLLQIVHAKQVM